MSWPGLATNSRLVMRSGAIAKPESPCRVLDLSAGTKARRGTRQPWRQWQQHRVLAELAQTLVQKRPGGVELSSHAGILDSVEQHDHIVPSLRVALMKCRFDLADRLRREQEATARVVEDLSRDRQLPASAGNARIARVSLELRGAEHLHAGPILGQAL